MKVSAADAQAHRDMKDVWSIGFALPGLLMLPIGWVLLAQHHEDTYADRAYWQSLWPVLHIGLVIVGLIFVGVGCYHYLTREANGKVSKFGLIALFGPIFGGAAAAMIEERENVEAEKKLQNNLRGWIVRDAANPSLSKLRHAGFAAKSLNPKMAPKFQCKTGNFV